MAWAITWKLWSNQRCLTLLPRVRWVKPDFSTTPLYSKDPPMLCIFCLLIEYFNDFPPMTREIGEARRDFLNSIQLFQMKRAKPN